MSAREGYVECSACGCLVRDAAELKDGKCQDEKRCKRFAVERNAEQARWNAAHPEGR